jgi:heme/copper-type cytochrome/quinol oxidase subunit 2
MTRIVLLAVATAVCGGLLRGPSVRAQDDTRKTISVTARARGFDPAQIEVRQNDLVHVTFTAEDAPHAFMIDDYRIAKRALPGHQSTFEFRADRAGRFRFYCTLAAANGQTHDERGELIVRR